LPGGRVAGIAFLIALGGTRHDVSAHRLDECLQAARIAIEPDHVTVDLEITPGIAVAAAIIGDIDRDGNGVLSATEQDAYARQVLDALDLAIDGRQLTLMPAEVSVPDVAKLRQGEAAIHLRATRTFAEQSAGTHQVVFRNRYRRELSVYLANALVPDSDRLTVTSQQREAQQHELTIGYSVRHSATAFPAGWLVTGVAAVLAILAVKPRRNSTASA